MNIREATHQDFELIWPIFHEIAAAGETYAYPRDISKEQALKLWMDAPRTTYVLEEAGTILGTYYIKTNQAGPGDHVCNCGYKAMQFNLVASTNEGAVRLWNKLGFATVGRLPSAFHHPSKGYVDALVMYKWLEI